jgi:hypothetical protein
MPVVTNECLRTNEHQVTKETIDQNIDEQLYNSSASCHVRPTTMHNNFA